MAKYTDEQIKKALELCINWEAEYCEKCPFDDECDDDGDTPLRNALDLINRQEAEIKILEADYVKLNANNLLTIAERNAFRKSFYEMVEQSKIIKSEAIKEFAERLKAKCTANHKTFDGFYLYEYSNVVIDNLVKEMVGESK